MLILPPWGRKEIVEHPSRRVGFFAKMTSAGAFKIRHSALAFSVLRGISPWPGASQSTHQHTNLLHYYGLSSSSRRDKGEPTAPQATVPTHC
jgi:hypothetical protein